jgi:APA family basic amino acid/polyamine antiporter
VTRSLGELRRILGPAAGAAVAIGTAVGAGILRVPGEVAAALGDPWLIAGAWVLGLLVATLDALILAEMASSVPRVGGLVAYVRLSFGPAAAFVVGWSMLLVTWPASLAGVAVATGELITGGTGTLAVYAPPSNEGRAVATLVIVAIGGLNLIGLRFGAGLEIVLVLLKVLLLGGICAAAAIATGGAPEAANAAVAAPAVTGSLLAAAGGAMAAVIWTFDGYADAVYLAGETRDPGRAMPRALLTSLLTVGGLYLFVNAALLLVLGAGGLAQSKFPALDLSLLAFGPVGADLLTAVALVLLFGAVNPYFLTGPRIARVMAEEGLTFAALGRISPTGAPVLATVWMIVVAALFALTNTFDELLAVTVPIISATTALVAAGLLVQRRRAPERARPFRVPCAGLIVGLQLAIGLGLLVSYVMANPQALAIDAAAVGLGLAAYLVLRRRRV